MTATSFISRAEAHALFNTNVSVALPSGTQDDDLMVAIVGVQNSASTTPPSGWTLIGVDDSNYFVAFYKKAISESGPYVFSQNANGYIKAIVATYRGGFNVDDPIDSVSSVTYHINNTILRAASFYVAANNSNIIFGGISLQSSAISFSPPTNPMSFTEDIDEGETTSDVYITFSHGQWSSSGLTGDIDATISVSRIYKYAFAISLNPKASLGNSVLVSMGF